MNIIFIGSILGIIIMILRRLPEATTQHHTEQEPILNQSFSALLAKGLPARAFSKSKKIILVLWHKIWQFLLEAKGLKPSAKTNFNFQKNTEQVQSDIKPALIKNEQYYINLIKRNPKDNTYYDMLGQYYLEEKKMVDAVNVYDYLVNHNPTIPIYWARLGLASLHEKEFIKAEEAYIKAVALDPSNPRRYFNLALALKNQKKFAPAISAMNKALELDQDNKKYQSFKFELETKAKITIPIENIHKTK